MRPSSSRQGMLSAAVLAQIGALTKGEAAAIGRSIMATAGREGRILRRLDLCVTSKYK